MGDKISFNNWVWAGVALVIGLLAGWWINDLINPTYSSNGSFSTYSKGQGVGRIILNVPAGDTGIVTSTMSGPDRKLVRVSSNGADIPISNWVPATAPFPGSMQTCNNANLTVVGWKLLPGDYMISVGYDYQVACDGILPTHSYAFWPTVITTLVSGTNGTATGYFPADIYQFDAHCDPDDKTGITIILQSN